MEKRNSICIISQQKRFIDACIIAAERYRHKKQALEDYENNVPRFFGRKEKTHWIPDFKCSLSADEQRNHNALHYPTDDDLSLYQHWLLKRSKKILFLLIALNFTTIRILSL